ncbi:MAG: ankyrin repeat domain-containing protein [Candidatus Latescibacteria bacterium]|nr:ankyrin repeat domain-containing protein [Candidatus Latescibacterota bacterium]
MSRPTKPPLAQDLVEEIVKAAHRDLDRVKELLAQEPALANACWDRGGGDWETPLGGAAHTGQQAIARYLLSQGARMDIFCAAMLGQSAAVQALLTAEPAAAQSRGPHGIGLAAHARAGGHEDLAAWIEAFAEEAGSQ